MDMQASDNQPLWPPEKLDGARKRQDRVAPSVWVPSWKVSKSHKLRPAFP